MEYPLHTLTERVIGAAITVHRALGPGLMMTYMKLTHCPVGLLLNFNVPVLKDGIRRIVLG